MQKLKNYNGLIWLWIAVLIIALDRASKLFMINEFLPYNTKKITSFLNIILAYNKGAAFSFLNQAPGWQMWLFATVAIIVCVCLIWWLVRLSAKQLWMCFALNFIIGGALGNLWDRFTYGHVIDFIQLHIHEYYWPVFNVADSAICVGAVMLIADALFKRSGTHAEQNPRSPLIKNRNQD